METKTKIAAALFGAQGEIQNISKDATNPFYSSKYATLTAVLDAIKPVLQKHGILIVQNPVEGKDGLGCLTLQTELIHVESGESIVSTSVIPLAKGDPQSFGSALSYARRYALVSMLGLAYEDDDAERATPKPLYTVPVAPTALKPGMPDFGVQSTASPAKPHATAPTAPKTGGWRDALIPIGKNKGVSLGEMAAKGSKGAFALKWYFENYKVGVKKDGSEWPDSRAFRDAIDAWHDEVHKEKPEPNYGDDVQEPIGEPSDGDIQW